MAVKNDNPTDAESYDERGSGYLAKREYDKAIADFSEVIRLDPEGSSGYSSRGLCYDSKGDYDSGGAGVTPMILSRGIFTIFPLTCSRPVLYT
jgi:tetratricopeptide (TPR) repeat protein